MTQPSDSDYAQPTGASGTDIRTNVNDYFEGVNTKNRGPVEPTTRFPGMDWIDSSVSPEEWNIRNAANSAWNLFATIDPTNGITILNEGAAVPGVGVANVFTENQTIDRTGAAGSLTIKSDRTTGIAASIDFAGHDDGANDTTYASIDAEVVDDTNGSEDGQIVARVLQNGSEVDRMTVGAQVDVAGVMNADTVEQAGITLDAIIEAEKGNMAPDSTSATSVSVPADLTRGERNRFTGSSASTWTCESGTAGDVFPVRNRGTANITFAEGSGVTIVGGLTLAPDQVCTIEYDSATTVLIYGQNI